MLRVNLLPERYGIKAVILRGDFRYAWYATRYPLLKLLGFLTALLWLCAKWLGIGLACTPLVLIGLLLLIIAIPVGVLLTPFFLAFWITAVIQRFVSGWDSTYLVVIPCAPTELPALRKSLLDHLSEQEREGRASSLLLENNILCQGTRRSAEWATRRLREAGIPCRIQRSYAFGKLRYPWIKFSYFQGNILELLLNFPVVEPER